MLSCLRTKRAGWYAEICIIDFTYQMIFPDVELRWTVVSRMCWSFHTEHHVISTSVPRKGTTEVQKITIFPGKIIFSWARFLRNVLTVPPSRAGKHALSLIIHSRCVYIHVPVFVRLPPIACTLMCTHAFDTASPLKCPWCSSGVMEGETNGLWQLGWSCRMQQIRNVNITDGKTEGKKGKIPVTPRRWILFFPSADGTQASVGRRLTKSQKCHLLSLSRLFL